MTEKGGDSAEWRQIFRGNVFVFGLVSFLTDIATEMIYPVLPAFFSGLMDPAAVAVAIGLMEGLSEGVSSLLKILFGRLSDGLSRRKPLALFGYALSSIVRPFTALAICAWQVMAMRLLDRVGKGIRSAPRDALLSESVSSGVRGRAFSFHRLMDHGGAVVGPLAAVGVLSLLPGPAVFWSQSAGVAAGAREMGALRLLFALAAIPGLAATYVLWRRVREQPRPVALRRSGTAGAATAQAKIPGRFFVFLTAVVLFTLGNSSDLFLIFYAQSEIGSGLGLLLGLWAFLHLSKIAFSMPGGWFADRLGYGRAIICGWIVYAGVYAALPHLGDLPRICVGLLFYGLFYGMTEGAELALVAAVVPVECRGRAYGLYHGAVGLATLPASLVFGLFWKQFGPGPAFLLGACLALAAVLVLGVALAVTAPSASPQ